MSSQTRKAQKFLMVRKNGKETRLIVDIEVLLQSHPKNEITQFLDDLARLAADDINDLVEIDRTNDEIDRQVSRLFRLRMAIRTMQEDEPHEPK